MVFTRQAVVAEPLRHGVESQSLQPIERSLNDFFGVAMELDDEGRQQGERMATPRTKQASDRNRIGVGQSDQSTDITSMPAQTALSLAYSALSRFGKPLFLKGSQIIADLRFEQRDTVGSLSKTDNNRLRFTVSYQQNKTTIFGPPLREGRPCLEQPIAEYRLAEVRLKCPTWLNSFRSRHIERRCKNIGLAAQESMETRHDRRSRMQREDEPMYKSSHTRSENREKELRRTMISCQECSVLGDDWLVRCLNGRTR